MFNTKDLLLKHKVNIVNLVISLAQKRGKRGELNLRFLLYKGLICLIFKRSRRFSGVKSTFVNNLFQHPF